MISVEELLQAYREGRFPMCHKDGLLYWHDPDPRAVFDLPLPGPNSRAQRAFRRAGFTYSLDRAFDDVIRACADREQTWIDGRIMGSFSSLHRAGHAHSVEVWSGNELVGGIYGVAIRGAFFGESMFSRCSQAGKAAFFALASHLQQRGYVLFDTQYANAFTVQLGAVEIPRAHFRKLLENALAVDAHFF